MRQQARGPISVRAVRYDFGVSSVRPQNHRFTVEDFYRMADAGILGADDRVELIDGEVVEMNPIGSRHAASVSRLNRLLLGLVADRAIVRVQDPVRLSDLSEPQPDLALLKFREDFYAKGHPTPDDVLLLIEVSDSSLAFDQGTKLSLYAISGIPEVWIIDLSRNVLTSYRTPEEGAYTQQREFQGDEQQVSVSHSRTLA